MGHSALFQELKQVDEAIKKNYSTAQLLTTLDILLYNAIDPIIEHTTLVDSVVANILPWAYFEGRRKISPLRRKRVITLLSFYLISGDHRQKRRILRRLALERNLLIDIVRLFIARTDPYVALVDQSIHATELGKLRISTKQCEIQNSLGHRGTADLYVMNRECRIWLSHALQFKNQIQEKYTRHALMLANSYLKSTNSQIDLDDLIQNFLVAINKAIDKCSANHGTLTSYINQWVRNATNSGRVTHEYGIAYRIPAAEKQKFANGTNRNSPNISVSLDELNIDALSTAGPESHIMRLTEIQRLRLLARYADPYGVGRRILGIEEILTEQEIKLQETSC